MDRRSEEQRQAAREASRSGWGAGSGAEQRVDAQAAVAVDGARTSTRTLHIAGRGRAEPRVQLCTGAQGGAGSCTGDLSDARERQGSCARAAAAPRGRRRGRRGSARRDVDHGARGGERRGDARVGED